MEETVTVKVVPNVLPRIKKNKINGQIVWFIQRTVAITLTADYDPEDGSCNLEMGHLADDFIPFDDVSVWEDFNGKIELRNWDTPVAQQESA